jgi:hypothetical protein
MPAVDEPNGSPNEHLGKIGQAQKNSDVCSAGIGQKKPAQWPRVVI